MIKALKAIVVPRLRELGFTGRFPHFRRETPATTDLVMFQFDRHGGGLVLELGQCARDFALDLPDFRVPHQDLTAAHLPLSSRARLQRPPGSSTDEWFRYDRTTSKRRFDETVRELLEALVDVERLFANFRSDYLDAHPAGANLRRS